MASNKIYTKVEIEAVQEGLNHYFPYEIGFISSPKTVDDKWSDLNGVFKWHGRDDFFTTLSEITNIQRLSFAEIKSASGILEKMKAAAPKTVNYKGAEDSPVQANRPGKEMLEQLEKENQRKEAQRKEVIKKSDQEVRNAIKRQQEIYTEQIEKAKASKTALKNKKIYYKVEKIPFEQSKEIKDLKQQAEANPKEFIKDVTQKFNKSQGFKNLSAEETRIVSEQAAVTSYEILTGSSPLIQSAVINKIVSDPKILNSIPDVKIRESLKGFAESLTNQKITQYELSKQFFDSSKIDGFNSLDDIKVEFSDTPQSGFEEFNFNDQIITPNIENLNQQSVLLDNLKGFGEGEIRSSILSGIGVRLESYVAKLPVNSLLARTYNSEVVQLGLSSLGIVQGASWVAVEGSFIGRVAIGTGLGPAAGFIQGATGVNLGVTQAAVTAAATEAGVAATGTVATVATEAAVTTAGATVGATGGAATAATVGAAAGSVVPGAGTIIGAIVGFFVGQLGGKVVEKVLSKVQIFLKKNNLSEAVPALLGAGISIPFLGIGAGLGIGGGIFGGLKLLSSTPTSRTWFGRGIGNFFGAVAKAILGAIGGPILLILFGFPLIIVLILFIINSGAYIVPPSLSSLGSENPYIDIVKTSDPEGPLQNSDLPLVVTYTITITAKQQALTNVVIEDECSVISESGSRDCPAPDISVPGGTISVGSPFVFTYTADFDSSYKDSLVVNTVTVTASTADGGDPQSASGGMSITIGNPPTGCLKIDGPWPANYKANMESAVGTLASKYSNYLSKVCLSYSEIPLRFDPAGNQSFWGWNTGQYIKFYPLGVKSSTDALYTLSHELGHSLSWGSKTAYIFARYLAYPGIKSEAPYCFYSATASWNASESLPESIALSIIEARCGSVQARWPVHARFLKNFVFN